MPAISLNSEMPHVKEAGVRFGDQRKRGTIAGSAPAAIAAFVSRCRWHGILPLLWTERGVLPKRALRP